MEEIERILIVDDEPLVLSVLRATLERPGREIVEAGTCKEAMEALSEEFGLAILDKNLPDGTGIDILEHIKKEWEFTEVIILTGYPSIDSAIDALRRGASDYLRKPLPHLEEVENKAALALERYRLRSREFQTFVELREAERLQTYAKHAQMMAALGGMMASMMHELRSPLAVLTAHLTFLENACRGDVDLRDVHKDMVTAVDQITSLMSDVRYVSGVRPYDKQAADLVQVDDLLDRALSLSHAEVKYKAEISRKGCTGTCVEGSEVRLTQVLLNLLVNAAHAIPQWGAISLSVEKQDEWVCIRVGDNGSGIPEALRSKIFEPFFTSRDDAGGTGLGLPLAAEIVEEHGGKLALESTSSEGTVFSILLPRVSAPTS